MLVHLHLVPAHSHGLDGRQGRVPGGGQVDVQDHEAGEEPGDEGVEGGQPGQAAQPGRDLGPALSPPHGQPGDDLQGQQDVEDGEVGGLLERVQLVLRRLLEGVRLPAEDAPQIVLGLDQGLAEVAPRLGQVLADLAAGEVVEGREDGVGQQDEGQHVVHGHGPAEVGPAQGVRPVDHDAGGHEQQDGEGLEPVPEAFVHGVHVDLAHGHIVVVVVGMAGRLVDPQAAVEHHAAQGPQEHEPAQDVHPVCPVMAGHVEPLPGRVRLVVEGALVVCVDPTTGLHVGVLQELGRDIARNVGGQQEGPGDAGVLVVAGLAVLGGPLAVGHVVVDAVGLDLAPDARLLQAQALQPPLHHLDFGVAVQPQLGLVQLTILVGVKGGQDLRPVAAVLRQVGGLQILEPHRALRIPVDPVPGADQVEGGQQGAALDVPPPEEDRLVARDQGVHITHGTVHAPVAHLGRPLGGDDRPVVLLDGRFVELGHVAGLAAQGAHVQIFVGEPLVGGLGVVAGLAAAHGLLVLGACGVLGRGPLGELVAGPQQVLAQVQPPGIELQVLGALALGLLVVDRVVHRVVAVDALQVSLRVDVEGAAQVVLAGQVEPGVLQPLARKKLPGALGVPVVGLDLVRGHGLAAGVDRPVTLATVLRPRILDGHPLWLQAAVLLEGIGDPLPALVRALHQAGAQQGGRVGPLEAPRLELLRAGLVVGIRQMAEEAVHLLHAGRIPVPGLGLARLRILAVGDRVPGLHHHIRQGCAVGRHHGRAAARVTSAQEHEPVRGAQVEAFIALGREVAVDDGIPAAVEARTHLPGSSPAHLPRLGELLQPHGGVEAVAGDVLRVVAGAAGGHGGHRLPRHQDIHPVLVQQGEGGVDGRGLGQDHPGPQDPGQQEHQDGHGPWTCVRKSTGQAGHLLPPMLTSSSAMPSCCSRPPKNMGSPW